MGGIYREGLDIMSLQITSFASRQVPLRTPSYFVVTCTARLYLPSLLHAYVHAFITSSYASNYLVCISPGCQPSMNEASYLRFAIYNRASAYVSSLRRRATRTALTTDQQWMSINDMDLSWFSVAFGKPMHQCNGILVVSYSAVHHCCWQESKLMMTLFRYCHMR
jgi:hypothetical protein